METDNTKHPVGRKYILFDAQTYREKTGEYFCLKLNTKNIVEFNAVQSAMEAYCKSHKEAGNVTYANKVAFYVEKKSAKPCLHDEGQICRDRVTSENPETESECKLDNIPSATAGSDVIARLERGIIRKSDFVLICQAFEKLSTFRNKISRLYRELDFQREIYGRALKSHESTLEKCRDFTNSIFPR